MNIEMLHEIVAESVSMRHPLCVSDINLCEIVKKNQLATMKLQKLKEICEHLDIDTSRLKRNKKAPYVAKIEECVWECTCFK